VLDPAPAKQRDPRTTSGPRGEAALRGWALALACASIVMALDQITKQIAVAAVDPGHPVQIIFGIEIANVRNNGVAFGLLGGGGDVVVVVTIATMALLLGYFAVHADRPGLWLVVGLVIGGALGNLADRVRLGGAIDFIDPPLWPAFNLADVAIVGGVVWLALTLLSQEHSHDGHS
jgi:signal peptidase II